MVLFWRLILAHVIADFPLQTDAVFSVKKNTEWGVFLHGAIFTLTALLTTVNDLAIPMVWVGLISLGLFHVAVDKGKLVLAGGGRRDNLGYFLLDQALHIGAIGLMSFFFSRLPDAARPAQDPAAITARLQMGTAYVVAIWVSPLLSHYLRSTFHRPPGDRFHARQPALWRTLGYVERGCLVALLALGGRLLALAPLLFLPRIILSIHGGDKEYSHGDFILGSAVAIIMGVWVRTL
jgi:hypothetical protein